MWKAPRFRNESHNWAGWEAFRYGDEYTGPDGEKLSHYLNGAPARMTGAEKIDSYVRRGDLILCRIDSRIWEARRHNREMRSTIARQNISLADVITMGEGVSISGPGMTKSERPAGGFKVGESRPPLPHVDKVDANLLRTELLPENRKKE